MLRRTPPICLCSSFRIVLLPRPTPPHKRTIEPTCRPDERQSNVLFWAGHSWTTDWFDINECWQSIPTPENLKSRGAFSVENLPAGHPRQESLIAESVSIRVHLWLETLRPFASLRWLPA